MTAGAAVAQCVAGTNSALGLDGVDDRAVIPDDAALDGLDDFTLEPWVNAPSQHNQGLSSKYGHRSDTDSDGGGRRPLDCAHRGVFFSRAELGRDGARRRWERKPSIAEQ